MRGFALLFTLLGFFIYSAARAEGSRVVIAQAETSEAGTIAKILTDSKTWCWGSSSRDLDPLWKNKYWQEMLLKHDVGRVELALVRIGYAGPSPDGDGMTAVELQDLEKKVYFFDGEIEVANLTLHCHPKGSGPATQELLGLKTK